ncbi:MAG: 4Fe-4S binding protein [bacterium]
MSRSMPGKPSPGVTIQPGGGAPRKERPRKKAVSKGTKLKEPGPRRARDKAHIGAAPATAGSGKSPAPPVRKRDLQVFLSWCKRCGICIAFCPAKALEAGEAGAPRWAAPERCVGCRLCELRCPDFAIEVLEEAEEPGDAAGE